MIVETKTRRTNPVCDLVKEDTEFAQSAALAKALGIASALERYYLLSVPGDPDDKTEGDLCNLAFWTSFEPTLGSVLPAILERASKIHTLVYFPKGKRGVIVRAKLTFREPNETKSFAIMSFDFEVSSGSTKNVSIDQLEAPKTSRS